MAAISFIGFGTEIYLISAKYNDNNMYKFFVTEGSFWTSTNQLSLIYKNVATRASYCPRRLM